MAFSLGDYTDMKELAHGGMGVVYKAIQRSLNRSAVIKKMSIDLAGDPKLVKRFENEAKAAAALDDDNVVKIYDFGEDKGAFYIVMEFVDGPDLEHLLRDPVLPKEIGLMVMLQAIKGIHHAHMKGIAHRDIKPANIMVSAKTGKAKVLDFGLAHVAEHSLHLTATNAIIGTPLYMSPEQATGEAGKDSPSDIFAVGVLLYRIVAGRFPFAGDNVPAILYSIVHTKEQAIQELAPALPDDLLRNISLCLIKGPNQRLESLAPLIESLQNYFYDIGIRDVSAELANQISKQSAGLWNFLKRLLNYHLSKGKEYARTGEYQKSSAHLKEALKYDPANSEVTGLINSIEGLEATIPQSGITAHQEREQVPLPPRPPQNAERKGPAHRRLFIGMGVGVAVLALGIPAYLLLSPERGPMSAPKVDRNYTTAGLTAPTPEPALKVKPAEPASSPVAARGAQPVKGNAASFYGTLAIAVDPRDAIVKIDGRQLSTTEMKGIELKPGDHELIAAKFGFETYSAGIAITQGVSRTVSIALKPSVKAMGVLHVFSNPWADLYIDGQRMGIAPTAKPLPLSEGRHLLVLKREGYEPYEELVTIQGSQTSRVKAEMTKLEQ